MNKIFGLCEIKEIELYSHLFKSNYCDELRENTTKFLIWISTHTQRERKRVCVCVSELPFYGCHGCQLII